MAEQSVSALIPGLTNPALQRQAGSDALFDSIQHCALCGRVIEGRYAMVKAKIACVSCAARERDSAVRASSPSPAMLSQAANSASVAKAGWLGRTLRQYPACLCNAGLVRPG